MASIGNMAVAVRVNCFADHPVCRNDTWQTLRANILEELVSGMLCLSGIR